ncbi:MAG: hypothetical protein IJT66_04200, partial [Clostridia bacterium]|nr:hypothetical protein [Clostridia bacterium]
EVADHYRIPVVDLGGELYNQLKGSISGWIRNFNDSVHPNDNGHRLYADIMIGALKELLVEKPVAAHTLPDARAAGYGFSTLTTVMPDSFTDKDWTRYRWLDNTKYEKSGCQFRYSDLKIQFPEYLAPKDGASLSVSFTGNSFGFLGTVKEGTTLVFSIDGGQIKRIKGEASASAIEYPVFENLKNGDHTVHITIAGGEPYAAVAAFVVTGD